MSGVANIDVSLEQIAAFCRRNCITRMSLFGSVLRADYRSDSDIDVLVRFGDVPESFSAFDVVHVRDALSELFGRKVDLMEEGTIRNPFRRHEIMKTRQVVYETV